MYEYVGNIHIHSHYSDGSGSISQIAEAAQQAGLDFIIVTDHFTLAGKKEAGYRHGVLVLVGMEINAECNHYLALNIDEEVSNHDHYPQVVIDQVREQGGLGFFAHPVEKGSRFYKRGRTYPWTDWNVSGFTGLEIWNYLSQWRDGITSLKKALKLTLVNPHQALIGPYPEVLKRWDDMLQERLVVAIGGSDAHAVTVRLGLTRLVIDDYNKVFRCINTHVLTPAPLRKNFSSDEQEIYHSLARGRCFVAYDYFLPARGFRFYAEDGQEQFQMGDVVPCSQRLALYSKTPSHALVHLVRDGGLYATSSGQGHVFTDLVPGVYRLEVFHPYRQGMRPWIFSNPIRVE